MGVGFRARTGPARRTTACAALVVALGAPALTRAAVPAELSLTWQAPAGCPTPTDVEAQFARLLGGAARTPSGKHIAAQAVVRAAAPDRWSLELATVLDQAVGHRSLAGDSCASVASAAALILALMIDPAAAERAMKPPAPARTAMEPAPTRAPPPEAIVTTTAPREPNERAAVAPYARAFAGVVVALLPTPAPAVGLALGARRGRLGAELTGVATEERRALAVGSAGGDFRLLAGGARACGALGGHAVVWQVCLGGELERLSGTGVGVSTMRSRTALMGAATGGLLVSVPLGAHVALSLDLDAAVRPYRPTFKLDLVGPIFQIPLASGLAALGLIVTI
jgi:hypothetical protein